eukprot:RCo019525
MAFAQLKGKWSGTSQLFDVVSGHSTGQSVTLKTTVDATTQELTLRLTVTTPDGMTSRQSFTFALPTGATELNCKSHEPSIYGDCRITLKDEGGGLFLLRVLPPAVDRHIRVQTFTVTPVELAGSWYSYGEDGKLQCGGLMRAYPVPETSP